MLARKHRRVSDDRRQKPWGRSPTSRQTGHEATLWSSVTISPSRHGSSTGRLLIQQSFKRRLPIVSLLVAALALGCSGSSPTDPGDLDDPGGSGPVVGSGNFVTESRSVSGFSGVSIEGGAQLLIEQTGVESLVITAEDNILPLLRSDVTGGLLVLGPPRDIALATGGIVYELTVRDLNEVSISGAITVETTRIDTPRLDVTLFGPSTMTTAGTADEQRINISGPSRYEAGELQSREVWITASGPSNTTVRVSERLVVKDPSRVLWKLKMA